MFLTTPANVAKTGVLWFMYNTKVKKRMQFLFFYIKKGNKKRLDFL